MKVFIAVSCLLAVASAGYYGPPPPGNSGHYGGQQQHIPVLTENGVPQETPEVVAARASHLAALSQATAHHNANPSREDSGEYNYNDAQSNNVGYNNNNGGYNDGGYNNGGYNDGGYNNGGYNDGGYNDGGYNNGRYNDGGYDNRYNNVPQSQHHHQQQQPVVIGPNGVPQDAPDVAAAKAAHFAAYDKVNALLGAPQPGPAQYNAPAPYNPPQQHYNQPQAYHQPAPSYNQPPPSYNHHQGPVQAGPVDTPEVAAAKAAHFAAHNQAAAHGSHGYDNGQY